MLGLRFQAVASQLRVLAFRASDLNAEHLLSVAEQYLSKRVTWARNKRHDFSDVLVLWDVLNIDAVIELENQDGKLVRVGISLLESEQKGRDRIYDLKSRRWYGIRQALKLEQYWVLAVKWKDFPKDRGEWIDILYREIDTAVDHSGCRLIIL
ncbi:MAG: hypothetical protein ACXITR_01290 [Cyanobacterium sp.]